MDCDARSLELVDKPPFVAVQYGANVIAVAVAQVAELLEHPCRAFGGCGDMAHARARPAGARLARHRLQIRSCRQHRHNRPTMPDAFANSPSVLVVIARGSLMDD